MHVRKAIPSDMTKIVELSDKFYQTTHYANDMPMCPMTVGMLVQSLTEHAIMLVAEHEGEIVGMIGCAVIPYIFNHAYNQCCEIVWYVDPSHRGLGIGPALIKANEEACNEFENVKRIQMIDLPSSPPEAAAYYERTGYFLSERVFTKTV